MLTTVYTDVPGNIFIFATFYKFEIVSKSQVKLKRPNGKEAEFPSFRMILYIQKNPRGSLVKK